MNKSDKLLKYLKKYVNKKYVSAHELYDYFYNDIFDDNGNIKKVVLEPKNEDDIVVNIYFDIADNAYNNSVDYNKTSNKQEEVEDFRELEELFDKEFGITEVFVRDEEYAESMVG